MTAMDLSRPRALLFMSVDLAGSTNFKDITGPKDGGPGRLEAFEPYFKELPLVLMGQVAQAFLEVESAPEVSVWKVIGYEIVCQAEPRTAEEALLLTEAFYRTVVTYDARLFERWPLRIRGCIWAALSAVPGIPARLLAGPLDLGGRRPAAISRRPGGFIYTSGRPN
jgi:hypothetical protein